MEASARASGRRDGRAVFFPALPFLYHDWSKPLILLHLADVYP